MPSRPGYMASIPQFNPYGNLTGKFQMKKTKTRGTKGLGAMTKVTELLSGQEV